MRVTIKLRWDEQLALAKVVISEQRKVNAQAAVLIHESLEQPGLTLINQIIVKEENYMGDKIEITGNIQDSIVNIKTDLNEGHQSINHFSQTNSLSYELHNLNAQLEKELRQLPGENKEEKEAVLEYASRLIEEAKKSKPNKTLVKISGEGLLEAAKNIAAIIPAVLTTATQIVDTIAKYIPPT